MGKRSRKSNILFQTLIIIVLVFVVNLLSRNAYSFLDLTEDKRFTLTQSTEKLLQNIDEPVYIDVLLGGDMTGGFKRLQNRTEEVIKQFKSANPMIEFRFRDPSKGTKDEVNSAAVSLSKDGIYPTNLTVFEESKKVQKLIYPYAVFNYGQRSLPVNLLSQETPGESKEVTLNRSANDLEYKFASAIEKLFKNDIPIIFFTTGNGELEETQTIALETELAKSMTTGRIVLDSIYQISQDVDVLIVARPQQTISERNKFILDQYLMNGGKIIWVIENNHVNVDSINMNGVYIPKPIDHGLNDLFFKYGVRYRNDLILDLQNSKIPQVVGRIGDEAQQQLFSWVYYPLLLPSGDHPIVQNMDRVYSNFPSTIELLDDRSDNKKSILLSSSNYSRFQMYPMRLSFEIIKLEQRTEAYNRPFLPVAVIVEGEFESFYKNKVSESMKEGLKQVGATFKESSERTAQIFISDAEIMKNLYNQNTKRYSGMGYNKWEQMTYRGNYDFMINTIDYLTDEYGLLEARSKNLQLRMLDQVSLQKNKLTWQLINVALPIFLVILFGFLFNFLRKRKYTS